MLLIRKPDGTFGPKETNAPETSVACEQVTGGRVRVAAESRRAVRWGWQVVPSRSRGRAAT